MNRIIKKSWIWNLHMFAIQPIVGNFKRIFCSCDTDIIIFVTFQGPCIKNIFLILWLSMSEIYLEHIYEP